MYMLLLLLLSDLYFFSAVLKYNSHHVELVLDIVSVDK